MRRLLVAGTSLTVLALGAPAVAQTPPGGPTQANNAPATQVQEVTVTARKREEKVFDVPAAISVVTPQQIEALHLRDARDLLTLVPTAFLQENTAGTARDISIRGVGTPSLFAEAGVALYQDGVFSSDFISYPTQFYDLERVEVLRGPQGALYGRDAVGGAVNVIDRRPTDRFEGSVQGTYVRYNRYELQGVLNVPITDTLAMRLFAWGTNQTRGEYFNTTLHRFIDKNDSSGERVSLRWAPTQKLTVNVTFENSLFHGPGTNIFFPTGGETYTTIQRDTEPLNHYASKRLSIQTDYASGIGIFTFIAGGRDYRLLGIEDTDLSADFFPSANAPLGKETTSRTNSVRSRYFEGRFLSRDIGPFNFLAGFNYLRSSAVGDIFTNLPGLSVALTSGLPGGPYPINIAINNLQGLESWAGFFEGTYKITPTLSLIGDLRYTSDDKSLNFFFNPSPVAQATLGPPVSTVTERSFSRLSPGGTLAWEPDADTRVYGKVQTGFRAGGFNFNVGSLKDLPFNQETSVNYEVGAKKRFWNGRAVVSGDVFYLTQDHVLVPLFDATVAGPLGSYLANVGRARTIGEEIEGSLAAGGGLSFSGSVGHLDPVFTSGSSNGVNLKGKELPSARAWTASITGSFRRPVFGNTVFLADASYTYRSSGYQDVANTAVFGGNNLINASAGLNFGHLEVDVYIQNALDDRYDIAFGGFRAPTNATGVVRAQGRVYGVTGKVSF